MRKTNGIVAKAKRLAKASPSWADLSNALFGPVDGLIAKEFPEKADRRSSVRPMITTRHTQAPGSRKSPETGLVAGGEPTKSGRFVVRLPKTLHVAAEKKRPRKELV